MANKYYQKHKEKLRKEACERCQNLFEEEKKHVKYVKILLKKKNKKSANIMVNVIKIFLNLKNKS